MTETSFQGHRLVITDNLNNFPGKHLEYLDFQDLYNSFKINWQLNSTYQLSFTATYTDQYKDAWNMLKEGRYLSYDRMIGDKPSLQFYVIEQLENGFDENGLPTMQVTANHALIDIMKNIRLDPKQPTEDSPDVSGGDDSKDDEEDDDQNQPAIVIKKTDEQTTYTLQNRLDQFFNSDDNKGSNGTAQIKYELHGTFPQAAVDCTGSLYEWLGQNLATFGAYYIPDNYVLKIYDLNSLKKPGERSFRYLSNVTSVNIQSDMSDMYNDFDVYGGKMEKDITSAGGGAGSLDSVEDFCKSPINADFHVNKQAMLNDFRNRDSRTRVWGVDVNRLYDTVKQNGVSPEWFFAYEIQEQYSSGLGWLNHTYQQGDPYSDAVAVCNWIKATANTPTITAATEGGVGNQGLAAKWNQEFPKGTIGHVYLQATAAAAWELEGINVSYYGKPLSGCVACIRGWGGHTVAASDSGWGWPFPSVGEGQFSGAQLFGVHPGGEFRPNNFHDGLDFGSIDHPGTEVHAVHGGTCTISRAWGNGGINWYCVIQDSTGLNVEYQEAFASPSSILVNVGDKVQVGQVIGYRNTSHLHIGITRHSIPEAFGHAFSNDGTWLDPQAMIENGGAGSGGSGGDDTSSTTSETYYSLYFHYSDADSIKRYGLHRGPQVLQDSIYDMNALKTYVDTTVPHTPPTSVTNNEIGESDFQIGEVDRVVVKERSLSEQMILMGVEYNPFNPDSDATLTWNNTALAMKDVINALYQDIVEMNHPTNVIDYYGGTGTQAENHFNNISTQTRGQTQQLSSATLKKIQDFTNS